MCGIFGIIGKNQVTDNLIEGLKRLEYRGYDSSGIAVLNNGELQIEKASGKIKELEKQIGPREVPGNIGIAHTRWATHGMPVTENAHPHSNGKIAVVHNDIIENLREYCISISKRKKVYKVISNSIFLSLKIYYHGKF